MNKYPKIQSIFKRDEKTHKFLIGEWSLPEFGYLRQNEWVFTEKINGTNIRVIWDNTNKQTIIKGKTDKAELYKPLEKKLYKIFSPEIMEQYFYDDVCLYGEGFGAGIQKGGGKYIKDDVGFILFDVLIGEWWLKREDLLDIAEKLNIPIVPIIGIGTLDDAIDLITSKSLKSTFGDFLSEGIVCKPLVELRSRDGGRIVTKLKHVDF
jgi:ATP-dependent RNA circularization protein (DNA/RNA ligase family)